MSQIQQLFLNFFVLSQVKVDFLLLREYAFTQTHSIFVQKIAAYAKLVLGENLHIFLCVKEKVNDVLSKKY